MTICPVCCGSKVNDVPLANTGEMVEIECATCQGTGIVTPPIFGLWDRENQRPLCAVCFEPFDPKIERPPTMHAKCAKAMA